MAARILVVDDDVAFRGMLFEALMDKDFEVETAGTAEEGISMAAEGDYDIVLHDMKLPGMSGIEALPHLKQAAPGADVIIMTAFSSRDSAVEALKLGAYDYFTKPFSLGEMEVVIRRALDKRKLQSEVRNLRKSLGQEGPLGRIIGDSPVMTRVKELIARVSPLETHVLVTGETGTGKELISDTIHALSSRSKGPFIKLNCAAIPESLLESELFGHEKGAFTGATSAKRGKFELAAGGTILLDELGDMPLHLQPKLLRAVEQKQVERIGGAKPVSFDVRIIAATNQDLAERMKDGEFRSDLYYRLNVANIVLPSLRERREDIPLLAEFFLRQVNLKVGTDIRGFSRDAMQAMFDYDWPGNVRQFANALERAVIFCPGPMITGEDMGQALQRKVEPAPTGVAPPNTLETNDFSLPLKQAVQSFERGRIEAALRQCSGVQTEAARLLGITPKNLWNKLQKHGLDPAAYSD